MEAREENDGLEDDAGYSGNGSQTPHTDAPANHTDHTQHSGDGVKQESQKRGDFRREDGVHAVIPLCVSAALAEGGH